ncbi:unnamed protein product [Kuraishia capsulata CBS 1993]|uniref:Glycerol uptake protein 1 n=1 Tax=Kuraishia capsulata CBS 1993 TaxID=1382522 RepID=W6MU09_9ASCO|nr:uncharacterized protein KUCA_T00004787001 [Kuraishia capsulata CBS 1993]CDK28802.1 unnamed protein product [Kuraishia capsulata CBS 1993]
MSFSSFFALQTLDGRLEPSAQSMKKRQEIISKAHKSRWSTVEFRVYLAVFVVVVPLMFKAAMEASNETNPNYYRYERILSNGWMFGRKVDNSDAQYKFFRDNFMLLGGLILLHSTLRRISLFFGVARRTFDFAFGLIFLFGAHGFNCIKILVHIMTAFCIGRYIQNRRISITLLWIYSVGSLFINDKYRRISYGQILPFLSFMDTFSGIINRWDVFFNFTMLRFLSFNLDYVFRKEQLAKTIKKDDDQPNKSVSEMAGDSGSETYSVLEKNVTPPEQTVKLLNDRERLEAPFDLEDYNIFNYLAYVTYTPLFIAGPIITFNDYMYQTIHTLPTINFKRIAVYALRLGFCILVMETLLHFTYVVAVAKAKAWEGDTPFQISMIGLFNLNIIWLKLLIPWRLFRLWSLIDGIDPPENMIRCMDNNYSAMCFWRAWHRSYNRWLLKYIYVPLGGSRYRIVTSLAVFSFVAVWHDIELRLLIWGWLVVLFLLPEIILTQTFQPYTNEWWYRHVCACGAVVNIWMMMLANLYGFCLNYDGMKMLCDSMFKTLDGWLFFLASSVCLFVAAQVMRELRQNEHRQGIDVKC